MQSKEEAKQKLAELIKRYESLSDSEKAKFNEEQTKRSFIEPFFELLGWNISNHREVSLEETISKKRADYGFRINEVLRFYLEAKALKEDSNRTDFLEQVVNYSWLKNCTWAVLTNFEEIKVFNALWKGKNVREKLLYDIHYSNYLTRFEDLWLLSRESFLENKLDEFAERYGKKIKREPVTKQIFNDFMKWREWLTKSIVKNNKIDEIDLDEAVQRILDRLVFIRVCEDRKIEPYSLNETFRVWQYNKKGKTLAEVISEKFREFDRIYNSKLFSKHHSETLKIDEEILEKIISEMYENLEDGYDYDFSAIDADVLGNIYEQYLGHILKKTEHRAKLSEKKQHRKEMGIYYTPTYIVDYIVKNTLGEKLKECKTIEDIEKIKVLDPACGSGSFLIRAFDEILNKYKEILPKENHDKLWAIKSQILTENLFGVDLDEKATEIAQLNLLLKALEKRQLLPDMIENIKNGNSLIDDEQIAYDKAFKWGQEFKEIMDNNGFEVIIGNPPYFNIRTNLELQNFCKKRYPEIYNGQNDVLYYFILKGLETLNSGGLLGFIVARYFLESDSAKKMRELILNNSEIVEIIDFGNNQVFEGVNVLTAIIILRKTNNPSKNNKIKIIKFKNKQNPKLIATESNKKSLETIKLEQKILSSDIWTFSNAELSDISRKIEKNSMQLGSLAKTGAGIQSGLNEVYVVDEETVKKYRLENYILRNYAKTRDIKPYMLINRNLKVIRLTNADILDNYPNTKKYLLQYQDKLKNRYEAKKGICLWFAFAVPRNLEIFDSKREKIITPIYSTSNKFGYDTGKESENYLTLSDTAVIQLKDKTVSTKAILAILNSKLMEFYYKQNRKLKRAGYYEYLSKTLETLPIKCTEQFQKSIEPLVDNMLSLNQRLIGLGDKQTSERQKLEEEIKRTDAEIDDLVYKLYGITDSEKKIIEESLK